MAADYKRRPDGRYEKKISIGYINGKIKRKTVYGYTKDELIANIEEIQSLIKLGIDLTKNVMFYDYKNLWLETKKLSVTYNTYRMYKIVLDNYTGSIDHKELRKIDRSDIQLIINENSDKGRTCEQILLALKQIFENAIDDNLIVKNPCRRIVLPKYEKKRRRALTEVEDIITDTVELTDREKMFLMVIKYGGLRKQDALALTKQDFNFNKRIIKVNKAVEYRNNKAYIKSTKSKYGDRFVPILENCITFFKYYLSNLTNDYLFTSMISGELISAQSYKTMWESIRKKMTRTAKELNLENNFDASELTAYIFRHNFATMLYYAGVSIEEAKLIMGHHSITMTLDIYTHLDRDKMQAQTQLDNFLYINQKVVSSKVSSVSMNNKEKHDK